MNGQLNETKNENRFYWSLITDHHSTVAVLRSPFYITSPRLRRNAGTSRSACSKFATIALRMASSEITSGPTFAIATGDDSSILGSSMIRSEVESENVDAADCTGAMASGKSMA